MPLITQNNGLTAILPPVLFGSTGYYGLSAQFRNVVIDCSMRYDKRFKASHRFEIADTRGRMNLTVPVSRPEGAFVEGHLRWSDILLSPHNHWWNNIIFALESAYGRTPFFEFYIDRLRPFFKEPDDNDRLFSLIIETDRIVRRIVCPETHVHYVTDPALLSISKNTADLRKTDFETFTPQAVYYQVRADRLGFIGGLSILDLIFNMGPESPLVLAKAPEYHQ